MAQAFVTGGTGFIGRHLVAELCARGDDVAVLVRPTSDRSVFEDLDVTFVTGDILDGSSYEEAVARADVVFHLASLLKKPWSPAFRSIHVEGTATVAHACGQAPSPPVLVLVSSLAAAGPTANGEVRDESMAPEPVSIYGRAKRDAERAAMAFAPRVPVTIVRPPAVFGPGDRTLLELFRTAARGVHWIPGNGDAGMSLVHVQDLARLVAAAGAQGERIDPANPDPGHGVYYVSCPERPAYGELGDLVAEALGIAPPRRMDIPRWAASAAAAVVELGARLRDRATVLNRDKIREAHAGSWTCSHTKAERDLGWRPHGSLRELLAETGQWYRDAGWLHSPPEGP